MSGPGERAMTMRILGGVAVLAAVGLIAVSARDSLSREAARQRAHAPVYALTPDRPAGPALAPASRPPAGEPGRTSGPVTPGAAPAADLSPEAVAASTTAASPAPTSPDQGSANAILTKAAAAYARVRSLRADFVQVTQNPVLGSNTTSRGTLFQRRPDRLLLRFSQPKGDILVSDGRYFWVYYPSVDPKQVVRMPASAAGQGVDLQAQFLGDPEKRFNARLQGREAVAGRPANVLHLVPRTQQSYKELTVWLDARDNLARRFEIVEQNGSVRRFDLSNLRVNVSIPASTFRFTPPAGAHIVAR